MKKQTALTIIMIIAFGGMLFSGYLSYMELFAAGCKDAIVSCGQNTKEIMSLPACVYGFAMYVVVFIVSFLGWKGKEIEKL